MRQILRRSSSAVATSREGQRKPNVTPLKRVGRPVGPAWPRARDALPTFAVASIGGQLLDRRPPAVTRPIIAFIIDPSYQVLRRWPVTHIGEEGCNASAPSQTN